MLAIGGFIVVPLLGALVVAAESMRRNGETRFWRRTGRALVAVGGVILAAGAALLPVGVLLVDLPREVDLSVFTGTVIITTLLLTTGLLAFVARSALRVAFALPAGESVEAVAKSAGYSDELRLSGWILILAPLLQFSVPGLIFIMPVLLIGMMWWTARRAREAQFLWVLAMAVENDLPVEDEVEAFAYALWSPAARVSGRLHDAFGFQTSAPTSLVGGGRYGEIANRMREGRSLLDALELSGALSRPLVAELRAAQAAGTLPQALRKAAAASTTSLLNNRFDGSMGVVTVYVWCLLVVIFNVVAFLMYWIVPKFKDIFNDFGVELPTWTLQAIHVSDAFVSYFYLVAPLLNLPILAGAAIAVVGLVGWGNLNYPLLMRWFPRRDAPSLLQSLAYAVEAGRPLPKALGEMAEHEQRRDLRERIERIQQSTDLGQPVWTVLAGEGFITQPEASALEAAARAGNLAWGMRTLADSMQRLSGHRVRFWLEFVKPAAVIAVGCVVAFFVIAFFLPVVKLISDLTLNIT